jgi:hypothetical protein
MSIMPAMPSGSGRKPWMRSFSVGSRRSMMNSPMKLLSSELTRLATSETMLQPLKRRSEVSRPLMPSSDIVSSPLSGRMPNTTSASMTMSGPLTPSVQEKPMPTT